MNNKKPILYKGCNSTLFSAYALVISLLGAGLVTIIALIIELI